MYAVCETGTRKGAIATFSGLSGLLIFSALALAAQQMPQIDGESLAGHKISLPQAVGGRVAVLVLGFSRASKTSTTAWGKRINEEFGSRPGFEVYQLPVLEDVPRMIRGMVISSIKGSVPENLRDHFVPVLHGESELKRLVSFHESDDAYLVLLSSAGEIQYQTHGDANDANYAQLREHIGALLAERK